MTAANLSASYSLSNETFKKKKPGEEKSTSQPDTDADSESLFGSNMTTTNPTDDQDESKEKVANLFGSTIPWTMRLRYSMGYSNSRRQDEIANNSIQFSGKVELSTKLNVGFSSGYDIKRKGITYTNLSFERDLDSWRRSFNWVPFGNTTYYFFIGVKSSVLSDLKYDQRKAPDRRLF